MTVECNWCKVKMKVAPDVEVGLHLHRACRAQIKKKAREIDSLLDRYRIAS